MTAQKWLTAILSVLIMCFAKSAAAQQSSPFEDSAPESSIAQILTYDELMRLPPQKRVAYLEGIQNVLLEMSHLPAPNLRGLITSNSPNQPILNLLSKMLEEAGADPLVGTEGSAEYNTAEAAERQLNDARSSYNSCWMFCTKLKAQLETAEAQADQAEKSYNAFRDKPRTSEDYRQAQAATALRNAQADVDKLHIWNDKTDAELKLQRAQEEKLAADNAVKIRRSQPANLPLQQAEAKAQKEMTQQGVPLAPTQSNPMGPQKPPPAFAPTAKEQKLGVIATAGGVGTAEEGRFAAAQRHLEAVQTDPNHTDDDLKYANQELANSRLALQQAQAVAPKQLEAANAARVRLAQQASAPQAAITKQKTAEDLKAAIATKDPGQIAVAKANDQRAAQEQKQNVQEVKAATVASNNADASAAKVHQAEQQKIIDAQKNQREATPPDPNAKPDAPKPDAGPAGENPQCPAPKFACEDYKKGEKPAQVAKTKRALDKADSAPNMCNAGGVWSSYQGGKRRDGKCKVQYVYCYSSANCKKCSGKGKAICSPLYFGVHNDGSPMCQKPDAHFTESCEKDSSSAAQSKNRKFDFLTDDINGVREKWNKERDNFNKMCATDGVTQKLNCSACKVLNRRISTLNYTIAKKCDTTSNPFEDQNSYKDIQKQLNPGTTTK